MVQLEDISSAPRAPTSYERKEEIRITLRNDRLKEPKVPPWPLCSVIEIFRRHADINAGKRAPGSVSFVIDDHLLAVTTA
jgi:hypothetical protein